MVEGFHVLFYHKPKRAVRAGEERMEKTGKDSGA